MYSNIRERSTKLCHVTFDWPCYQKTESAVLNVESASSKRCDCLPSCNSIDYNFDEYSERMRGTDENEKVTNSSFSIYFAEDEFLVFKRSPSFGTVSLLSNIGGLLGLFLGMSILSLVEIFYFFVIRFINNMWWKE